MQMGPLYHQGRILGRGYERIYADVDARRRWPEYDDRPRRGSYRAYAMHRGFPKGKRYCRFCYTPWEAARPGLKPVVPFHTAAWEVTTAWRHHDRLACALRLLGYDPSDDERLLYALGMRVAGYDPADERTGIPPPIPPWHQQRRDLLHQRAVLEEQVHRISIERDNAMKEIQRLKANRSY